MDCLAQRLSESKTKIVSSKVWVKKNRMQSSAVESLQCALAAIAPDSILLIIYKFYKKW
jgi:hypothetical protein